MAKKSEFPIPIEYKKFVCQAIDMGIQNDMSDVYVHVGEIEVSCSVWDVLGRDENYPFEASEVLEDDKLSEAWYIMFQDYNKKRQEILEDSGRELIWDVNLDQRMFEDQIGTVYPVEYPDDDVEASRMVLESSKQINAIYAAYNGVEVMRDEIANILKTGLVVSVYSVPVYDLDEKGICFCMDYGLTPYDVSFIDGSSMVVYS